MEGVQGQGLEATKERKGRRCEEGWVLEKKRKKGWVGKGEEKREGEEVRKEVKIGKE